MTSVLPNNQNGAFGFNIDGFVYPQYLASPQRAPLATDIYNPGTMWQNNAVSPAVVYYTTGGGNWYELNVTGFGVSSVTGTPNQVTATPATGDVVLSIPSTFIAPGSIAATSVISAQGNITTFAGDLTAINGDIVLGTVGNRLIISTGVGAAVGTSGALVGGTITVSSAGITNACRIFLSVNAPGGTPGILSAPTSGYVIGTSFTINSSSNTDTSTVNYLLIGR